MTRENLRGGFLALATEHGETVMAGDHKKANKIHKKLQKIYVQAQEQDQSDIFRTFLNDANDSVRLWAAVFTLKFSPDIAESTLNELTKLDNITSVTAKTILTLWKQGKLNLL